MLDNVKNFVENREFHRNTGSNIKTGPMFSEEVPAQINLTLKK